MKSSGREQGTQNRRSRSAADLAEGVVAILGNDVYAGFRAEPERS
ncbi:hypothetical protein [Streptomyces sp. NPDC001100]